jgi:UDP-2,3-diacylglucosamine hydrolase
MAVLFISDLHLSSSRPGINQVFFQFLRERAVQASDLYILGDLFEYWAGDDDIGDPFNAQVVAALAECARGGPSPQIMHGNRDFLLGADFAAACNARLIDDPQSLDLFGTRTLLMHGDTLCTDDVDYQRFRAEVRAPAWRKEFLSLPLAVRKERIGALRARSETEKRRKSPEIMDVNRGAVEAMLRQHGYPRLIHGHTHRPARHEHRVDGRVCERWVLPDWYQSGGVLVCDEKGCRAEKL